MLLKEFVEKWNQRDPPSEANLIQILQNLEKLHINESISEEMSEVICILIKISGSIESDLVKGCLVGILPGILANCYDSAVPEVSLPLLLQITIHWPNILSSHRKSILNFCLDNIPGSYYRIPCQIYAILISYESVQNWLLSWSSLCSLILKAADGLGSIDKNFDDCSGSPLLGPLFRIFTQVRETKNPDLIMKFFRGSCFLLVSVKSIPQNHFYYIFFI
jgi:hypothetical protein